METKYTRIALTVIVTVIVLRLIAFAIPIAIGHQCDGRIVGEFIHLRCQ